MDGSRGVFRTLWAAAPALAAAAGLATAAAAWMTPVAWAYNSPCELLEDRLFNYVRGSSAVHPTKPKNVEARGFMTGTGFGVYWSIPSSRPAGTVTGHYVHFTHAASGGNQGI